MHYFYFTLLALLPPKKKRNKNNDLTSYEIRSLLSLGTSIRWYRNAHKDKPLEKRAEVKKNSFHEEKKKRIWRQKRLTATTC